MNFNQAGQIVDGFVNLAKDQIGLLDGEIKAIAEKRYRHCLSCTMRDNNSCSTSRSNENIETGEITFGCGCYLQAKILSPDSKCPLSKW
jgi:hypothetical protein